ncbi:MULTISPECIES: response regulator transcription factor [Methylobacterium]|uniref:Transcriptional regulatory protein DegU n=3 Tax=Pseudomonadota TaxID=1224 RepID=A0ABQ4T1A1_9HYPH|nr:MULTISPECIES: response regulator transcription factor [Methylobacterium]PIU06332.1 MAG: DNA-binding response regulator [Methylobacterium sp. CG09_land_8_20_14_0_10_71_15]PIU13655.1 MAG: DNA-binding response regulator [Methylobacterium sp. CG08_land_8_20_14_0_20_71_15]GBU17445.1 two-component regulatory system response regulator NarL [Methylobacterium sp.]GJE08251.1 Transcriptional regulatory protein DegU [Methylobacterium jeotgali]
MRLLIVDDHPLFREALSSALRLAYPDAVLLEAEGIEAACAVMASERDLDLVLLDLGLQGSTGFEGLLTLRTRAPRVPVLIVSGQDEPRIMREALRHGAAGFVPKAVDKPTLTLAVGTVLSGALYLPPGVSLAPPETIPETVGEGRAHRAKAPLAERVGRLTPQQLRVLMLIRQGKLNKQIAHDLNVGDSTVKAHVSEILRKLEVISRTQIVIETAGLDFERA